MIQHVLNNKKKIIKIQNFMNFPIILPDLLFMTV